MIDIGSVYITYIMTWKLGLLYFYPWLDDMYGQNPRGARMHTGTYLHPG